MRRIGLAVILAASLTLPPLAVLAQQAGKVYRIGYLHPNLAPGPAAACRDGLVWPEARNCGLRAHRPGSPVADPPARRCDAWRAGADRRRDLKGWAHARQLLSSGELHPRLERGERDDGHEHGRDDETIQRHHCSLAHQ
jgi:hypothetical protein